MIRRFRFRFWTTLDHYVYRLKEWVEQKERVVKTEYYEDPEWY